MFFRFAPMGKVEKTRFEKNYTTFVNPALCAALKSPPKMVVWNQNFKIRFLGCFFFSLRWGKSKKRVLNKIIRPSSTRFYALLVKAHPKWWYETKVAKFDSQGVFFVFAPDGESRKKRVLNNIIRPSSTRLYALLGKAHPKWWYETKVAKIRFLGCFFRFAPMGKVEKNAFWTKIIRPSSTRLYALLGKSPPKMVVWNQSCKIRFPGCFFSFSPRWGKSKKTRFWTKIIRPSSTRLYALLGKAHPKWWYEIEIVKFDSQGVFSFRPDGGKSKKTRFEQNYTTFVNLALCAAFKGQPKMVVWKPKFLKFDSQCVFFVSPPMGKIEKNAFWTKLYDLRQPGFMRCLEKPTQKWWYENQSLQNSILRVFFRFAPMGESRKNAFWTKLYDLRQPGLMRCLEKAHLKWWYETEILKFDSQGVFFVSPRWGKSKKTRFETLLYDRRQPGFMHCFEKPTPKWWYEIEIVKIRFPRCFFRFAPMGKVEKNAFWTKLYDLRQPGFMHCFEKPTQNGGIKSKLQNSIPRVFFSFRPDGESRKKRVLNKIIRPSSTRLYVLLGKAHLKWWYETEILKIRFPGCFFRFAPMAKSRKKRVFEQKLYDLRQPGFMRCLEKPT